jgi:hypothetical protein
MLSNIFNSIMNMKTIEYVVFARIERRSISMTNLTIIALHTTLNENQSCQNIETKWSRRTFKTNFHVNDQHHIQKRRFKQQMMNRINQNNQLSSKSFFDDKQINHFFRNRHETKILFRSFSSNWDTNYVMKRKSIMKWKKLVLRSFFVVLVNYEKNHIYRILRLNEIIYRVSSVIWIKKKREKSFFFISETSTKQSIIESIIFSTKRQILKSNSIIIFMSSF